MTTPTPEHQRPEACHICGRPEAEHGHPSGDDRRGYGQINHDFWSNADAFAAAAEYDRRTTVRYPSGATTAEAHAVETFAPDAVSR